MTLQPTKPGLTWRERLTLLPNVLLFFPAIFVINICRYLVFYTLWRIDLRYILPCALARAALGGLEPRQLQLLVPSTRAAYNRSVKSMTKKYGRVFGDCIDKDIQELKPGKDSALLWLGNRKTASKVVYFLHGGGFFLPMQPGHFRWCWDMFVMSYASTGTKVACAVLQYTLSPGAKYPSHVREAAAGFEEIRSQGFSARDIIVGGDSAGGSLTTQLLLHMHTPHPEISPIVLDAPLPAAFLVSPFLTRFADAMESCRNNIKFDMVPKGRIEELMPVVIHEGEIEEYMCGKESLMTPLDTPGLRLEGLEKVVRKLNITIGECEVIADHGRDFANIVKKRAPLVETELVVGRKEPHDAVLLEYMMFRRGVAARRLKAFVDGVILGAKGNAADSS